MTLANFIAAARVGGWENWRLVWGLGGAGVRGAQLIQPLCTGQLTLTNEKQDTGRSPV